MARGVADPATRFTDALISIISPDEGRCSMVPFFHTELRLLTVRLLVQDRLRLPSICPSLAFYISQSCILLKEI